MSAAADYPTAGAGDLLVVELTVAGELQAAAVARLHARLTTALIQRPTRVLLDVADCPFLNAAAVEMLLEIHRRAWRQGTELVLRSPSPRVRRILRLTRADQVLATSPESP